MAARSPATPPAPPAPSPLGLRALCVTPHGRLAVSAVAPGLGDAILPLEPLLAQRLEGLFAQGNGPALLRLGAEDVTRVLPPDVGYWRDLGARYVTGLCSGRSGLAPEEAEALAGGVPPMLGAEYVTPELVRTLWGEIDAAATREIAASGGAVEPYLRALNPAWHVVGRVHLHLAENRKDAQAPFAFLATYTTRIARHGGAQHVPLGRALDEYAGAEQREALLRLLVPLQLAAESCPWLSELVASGAVFQPLRWSATEAARLLADVPRLESAGIVVRMPAGWARGRPPRPKVTVRVGEDAPSQLGAAALLDFDMGLTLEGEKLTRREIDSLLEGDGGLALLRGRWVEVDRARLAADLERMRRIERMAKERGLPFAQAARLLVGADVDVAADEAPAAREWTEVLAGGWLEQALRGLRDPQTLATLDTGRDLRGTLRPYQDVGVRWLRSLAALGLGACLADDMGLGKTLQVLALLLVRRRERQGATAPSLLVAPASLLGNWQSEAERFAPGLRVLVAHASAAPAAELRSLRPEALADHDLVLTSYGHLRRLPWLTSTAWDLVVLDEAHAIKNAGADQTRAAKALQARARVALTGTPIENRLGDLWSLFDFLNPGLLGSAKQFGTFTARLAARTNDGYAPLRELVRPYILRRMKTDRRVIQDLPEKTEVRAWCGLAPRQAALYQRAVKDLAVALEEHEGGSAIERRGAVLAALMRFKQICNHPSQWLGDGAWAEEDSGKLRRLRELVETIATRQEKVLVFTQFRECTAPLAAFLGGIFGRAGLVLHGGTPVGRRRELVRAFQEDDAVPFFVLSIKAGGSGLNLTAASHVVHFDRWWNPAVEDQATDRAFRIGQRRNVLVHKLVCKGTVEERIDALIEQKKNLVRGVLEGAAELHLTELPDAELLRIVALDLKRATQEA